jgi:hypothetical protein
VGLYDGNRRYGRIEEVIMKKWLLFFAICGVVMTVATVGTISKSKRDAQIRQQLDALEKAEDRGTIHWYVRRAKLQRQKRVVLRTPIGEHQEVRNFEEAIRSNGIILAELLEKRSYALSDDIMTWYRFKVVETLTRSIPSCPSCPFPLEIVPEEMLPMNPDELLIPRSGGEIESDGVKVEMVDPEIREFVLSKRYILFIQSESPRLAAIRIGPDGVFSVEGDEKLIPLSNHPYQPNLDLNARFDGSLTQLRSHMISIKE